METWLNWSRLGWPEKICLAAGASLVIYPILMLWTWLFKFNLYWIYAWLPPFIALTFLITKKILQIKKENKVLDIKVVSSSIFGYPGSIIKKIHWEDIAFILVLCVLVFTRFYPVRLLDYPMWGDSYQHTVITQLMLDNGGLFSSWQPYADMTSLTYHFGFHSLCAVFAWVTGVTAPQAVLVMGQLLNILAILGVYLLVVRFTGNRWSGIIALIIAGFASPMPMFYVNWGRYTQLTGQAILPIAILITLDIFHRQEASREREHPWLDCDLGFSINSLCHTHLFVIFVIVYFSCIT